MAKPGPIFGAGIRPSKWGRFRNLFVQISKARVAPLQSNFLAQERLFCDSMWAAWHVGLNGHNYKQMKNKNCFPIYSVGRELFSIPAANLMTRLTIFCFTLALLLLRLEIRACFH